jgi:alcohol dehydrogenase YqhD (iron-dependent ADH family)
MDNFTFQNKTKIIFGKGTESQVGQETVSYNKKMLLHYGGGSIKKTGLYDKVVASLNESGVEFIELGGALPNPRLSLVHEGIKLCRKHGIGFVLAVGGGSTIDSAKAIAAGVPYDGDVWDFFVNKKTMTVTEALPVGVILTLAATGSESSNSCVINRDEGDFKKSIRSESIIPQFAILNPELTFTLPVYQTACGITDILAHVMERYFTCTKNVDYTDRLCEATMKTVVVHAPVVMENPKDYNARAQIMWASTIAHNNLLNTGRVGDWASHHIQHEMSALYPDLAHGAGLAIVFPAWMKYVYRHDIMRFKQFAQRVWDVSDSFGSDEEIALEGIKRYTEFVKSIGMPISFADAGLPTDKFREMAQKCGEDGKFVKLSIDDIVKIYELAQ